MRPARLLLALALPLLAACQNPQVNVEAPPCDCSCSFAATAPQIGKGCYVSGDVLVCPLVRRTLEVEPAYPSEDPRCTKQPDGTLRCEVEPGADDAGP